MYYIEKSFEVSACHHLIVDEIPHCYKAKVAETASNVAIYEK